jgi:hypothetical protein
MDDGIVVPVGVFGRAHGETYSIITTPIISISV